MFHRESLNVSLLERARMLTRKFWTTLCVLAAVVAAEESAELKINAWGWLNFGRVGSGFTQQSNSTEMDIDFTKTWLEDFSAGVRVERSFGSTMKARLHMGVTTAYIVDNPALQSYEFWQRRWAAYLIDAAIEKNIAINDAQSMVLEFGYFPVRSNPDAANLGEYLFRSTPYPAVIESGFELADKERLAGLHASHKIKFLDKSFLKTDLYFSSAMRHNPVFDFSPAIVLDVNLQGLVDLGAGAQYLNMISVDERKTTPGTDPNRVSKYPERVVYIDPRPLDTVYITKDTTTTWGDDTTITVPYVIRDTTFYSFRGLKLMGRITLNPKELISWDGFGPEDLKIFAEVAVLGTKNYRSWYEDIGDRIPIMFGFNFPTFKVLDVLSIQLQYFKSPYWNSWEYMWKGGWPIPYQGSLTPSTYEDYLKELADTTNFKEELHGDDWKWSVYASRKIGKNMRLSLQFANDNTFKTKYMPPPPTQSKYTEIMGDTWMKDANGKDKFLMIKDWYWMAKIMFYL